MHRAVLNSATIASSHPRNGSSSVAQLLPNGTPQDGFFKLGFGADDLETVRGLTYQDHADFSGRVPVEHDFLDGGLCHTPEWILPSDSEEDEEDSADVVDGIAITVKHFNRSNPNKPSKYARYEKDLLLPQPPADYLSYSDEEFIIVKNAAEMTQNGGYQTEGVLEEDMESDSKADDILPKTTTSSPEEADLPSQQQQPFIKQHPPSIWSLANFIPGIRSRKRLTCGSNKLSPPPAEKDSVISSGTKSASEISNDQSASTTSFFGTIESRLSSTKNAVATTIGHYSSKTNKLFSDIENEILNVALSSVLPTFLPPSSRDTPNKPPMNPPPRMPLHSSNYPPTSLNTSQSMPAWGTTTTTGSSSNGNQSAPNNDHLEPHVGVLQELSPYSLFR